MEKRVTRLCCGDVDVIIWWRIVCLYPSHSFILGIRMVVIMMVVRMVAKVVVRVMFRMMARRNN